MMTTENAESTVRDAIDQGRQTAAKTGRAAKEGYDAAQEYVKHKGFNLDLGEFVRREPWLALSVTVKDVRAISS